MKARTLKSVDTLKLERINLLTMYTNAKTKYLKDNLCHKIKSVNRDLYTLTKETKYL
jgi:hypothetical protein